MTTALPSDVTPTRRTGAVPAESSNPPAPQVIAAIHAPAAARRTRAV
jgi:hypothetical protein